MLDDATRREIEASRDPREFMLGHPTAPGLRDEYQLRMGAPSPGNGMPGVPKILPGRFGTPGFPGQNGAPVQEGSMYLNSFAEDDDST